MKNLRRGEVVSVWLAVLGLALILGSPLAFAQQGNGTVSGTVRDASGAVVPGASVVLRNEASGTELRTTSDTSGLFVLNYVPVATYTLTVSSKGFKKSEQTGIHVAPDAALQEDATLQVGTQVETIEVKSTAVNLIPKSSGGMTPTIGAAQIQNESTVGRNALELLNILPGVVGGTGIPGGTGQNGGYDPSGGSGFQVAGGGINNFNINGLRNDQNMVKLDNSDIIDPGNAGGFTVEPNMDMIQEFSVKQSGFEAAQGNGGIIVDAVTKSGGSKFHGEGYYYGRNAALNANDWSNNYAGVPKPNSKFNYPGGNIGGPVIIPGTDFNKNRDKLFFFYGIEIQRQLRDPGTTLLTLPTAAMRNGDFSQLLSYPQCQKGNPKYTGNALGMPCVVNDVITGNPAPGNILPASEVTADGQGLLNSTYPFPDPFYNDPQGNSDFASRPLYPTNRIENAIRVDYNLTQNTRAFLRLDQNSDTEYYPYGLWWGNGIPRISPDKGKLSGEVATINVVQVINPTLTNEVQFSMNANNFPWKLQDPSKAVNSTVTQDLPGFNWLKGYGGNFHNRSAASPYIWNGVDNTASNWTGSDDTFNGVIGDKTTFEVSDNITKVKGTHTLQFGLDILHTRNDQNSGNAPQTEGEFWATGGSSGNAGNVYADLLDQGYTWYEQNTNDVDGLWRFWNYEWYAQDSWKVTRKLTLNYGSRFAYMPPWYEARGDVGSFNPKLWTVADDGSVNDGVQIGSGIKDVAKEPWVPSSLISGYTGGLANSGGFPNPHITIEPRLAFAYDVFGTGKTVVCAGAGVYETRDQGNTVFGAAQNPPFQFNASVATFANNYLTPSGGGWANIQTYNPYSSAAGLSNLMYDQGDNHGPMSYEYNFTIDQDIGHQTIVEVAYVGNVARHLFIENIVNGSAIPLGTMWVPGTQNVAPNAFGSPNSFRYYKPWGGIDILHHVSTSNYNSLQATVRRNVTHGLTLLTSYTYSKTLGYNGAFNGVVDPFDSKLNYGLLSYDRPQNLNISYIYQMPDAGTKYFGGNKIADGFLNGWQLSGITNYQSGAPMTIGGPSFVPPNGVGNGCISPDPAPNPCTNSQYWNNGNDSTMWYGTPDRGFAPQLVFNSQKGANFKGVNSTWLNPASVTVSPIGNPGTREQPQMLGPASNNWDMTLFKSFPFGEQRRVEFRFAAFDIFNRAQLDNPQTSPVFQWILPSGATSLAQGHPSQMLNGNGTCASGEQFGCILDKHGHREMEVAIKIYF